MSKIKICSFLGAFWLLAQTTPQATAQLPNYGKANQQRYTIGDITASGLEYLDADLIRTIIGLSKGDEIKLKDDPQVTKAIKNLWSQQMFTDIKVSIDRVEEGKVYLNFTFKERPRLNKFVFKGVTKTQETEIKEKLHIAPNKMVTEAMKKDIIDRVKRYFSDKGFVNVETSITEQRESATINTVSLVVTIDKGKKTHINQVLFSGNDNAEDARLKGSMKGTKEMPRLSLHAADNYSVFGAEGRSFKKYVKNKGFLSLSKTLDALNPYFRWNIFAGSKFNPKKYEEDKKSILAYYNSKGYRDAQIEKDTLYTVGNGNLNIELKINEGKKYYFGDIQWRGNSKYSDSLLTKLLGINKGDVYNEELFHGRLGLAASPDGQDISSLYMDDGYLFFKAVPIEKSVINDTINYEIVLTEGPEATIKNVGIFGNERTNEHVIRRELFTMPGNKFSRSDIIRSIRQVANLGFVDPEKIIPTPKPNYEDGTVDIDYAITEKSSDQLELSAGFGGGIGFTGTVGIVFNNFSLRNLFKLKEWDPLPMGDGQKLSLRYQSNGLWYNSANFSFTEPWLGGKKPTALTVSGVYGRYSGAMYGGGSPNDSYMIFYGGGATISKRLRWPDDAFVFSYGVNYQRYRLKDYENFSVVGFTNGNANNLSLRLTLARNSVDQPIYPRNGANINFSFQFTPPYSLFSDTDFKNAGADRKYKWIEYHKYRFTADWYQRIAGDLVLKLSAKYGFMGYYNKDIGYSPFERFNVGGDGMAGFNMFIGRDIISQRGYEVYAEDAVLFNKYTAEIRYPFSLNPSATIFGLAFVEGANGWHNYSSYDPFKLYRSAGVGIRAYLPMFGLLGLDYGLGFDRLGNGTRFGNAARFTFMLGFEPD